MDDPFERAAIRTEVDRRRRRAARQTQGTRTGFRIHATAFVGVQLALVAIWVLVAVLSDDWYPWFVFPLLGWGIGLAAHYLAVRDRLRRG